MYACGVWHHGTTRRAKKFFTVTKKGESANWL
jgi:hypothetical protein